MQAKLAAEAITVRIFRLKKGYDKGTMLLIRIRHTDSKIPPAILFGGPLRPAIALTNHVPFGLRAHTHVADARQIAFISELTVFYTPYLQKTPQKYALAAKFSGAAQVLT